VPFQQQQVHAGIMTARRALASPRPIHRLWPLRAVARRLRTWPRAPTIAAMARLAVAAFAVLVAVAPAQEPQSLPRVLQGPMLGEVRPDGFTVWARVSGALPVSLEVTADAANAVAQRVGPIAASKAEDYVVKLRVSGLQPGSSYVYRVLVDGQPDPYLQHGGNPGTFAARTAPANERGAFRVAFGSCAKRSVDPVQTLWVAVQARKPDLFLWLGDNIYGDSLDADILAEEYRSQRMVPSLQPLLRSVPQLATWDDHDFGINDGDSRHPQKQQALAVFSRYWANPAAGVAAVPGTFFRFVYGGIDFFFLDDRYYRSPNAAPDDAGKTMLGRGQLAWLQAELQQSKSPFKVLVSGSPWSKAKGKQGDAWSAFRRERDELFEFLRARNIGGVVLLSGDTHVAELNCIPWSLRGGYDLYDFCSSPLAQECATGVEELHPELRVRPVFSKGANFGVLEFDLRGEATLTYRCVAADGSEPFPPFVLAASELQNGVTSWPAKVDTKAFPDARPDMDEPEKAKATLPPVKKG
jgi:alkaline phosphatase D